MIRCELCQAEGMSCPTLEVVFYHTKRFEDMNKQIQELERVLKKCKSEYALAPEWVAPATEVDQLLGVVLQGVPTHFNSQPVRMVLLKDEAHRAHWKLIEQILIKQIGEEAYNEGTRAKIEQCFLSGAGTVLFFDDTQVTKEMQEQFPTYAHNFPIWAQQVQGSHQVMVWLGLSELGFGASLQHYNGMEDEAIRQQVGVPSHWSFVAHMPFGKVLEPAELKDKKPLSETLLVQE